MTIRYKAVLCAAALLAVAPVHAATIVQTVRSGNGPAYANPFDTRFGQLTSVTVDSTYFAVRYFQYGAPDNPTPIITATGTLGDNRFGVYNFTGSYQSYQQDPGTIGIRINGSASAVTTEDFGVFVGPNPFTVFGSFSRDTSFQLDGRELAPSFLSFPGQGGGSYTITYDYVPMVAAIPEPATWALMLAGFAMTGYALRRRRASVALA